MKRFLIAMMMVGCGVGAEIEEGPATPPESPPAPVAYQQGIDLVTAIANGAFARYQADGTICKTTNAVPSAVLPTEYVPSGDPCADFDTARWKCVGFRATNPIRYRLTYESTDDGFVAMAEGNVDGDLDHSRFVLKAKKDPNTGKLVLGSLEMTNPTE